MYDLGHLRGVDHSNLSTPINDLVILEFGNPQTYGVPGNYAYGVMLYDYASYIFMSDVEDAVHQYVNGYLDGCANNHNSTLTVVVGTNSSGVWINYDTGQAWRQMIFGTSTTTGLRFWVSHLQNNNPQHVFIEGGIDIEPDNYDWQTPSFINQWLHGYASIYSGENLEHRLYAFNAATACPYDLPPNEPPSNPDVSPKNCNIVTTDRFGNNHYTWTQEDVYEVSYHDYTIGVWPDIYPIPQIYVEPTSQHLNGINAEQWYRIGLYYHLKYGYQMAFLGVITQQKACSHEGGCPGAENSSSAAMSEFSTQLSSDPHGRTTSEYLNWATDIGFFEGIPY